MLGRLSAIAVPALTAHVLTISQASAYATFHNHRLTYGIVNQTYWISPSATSYADTVIRGWNKWNNSPTPAAWSRTYTQSASHVDVYQVSSVNTWWGLTSMYVNTTQVLPDNQDWWWAKVQLDGDFANCPNPVGVAAHEDGHAMGLAHVSGGDPRLMRSDIASLTTTAPWVDDSNGINALY